MSAPLIWIGIPLIVAAVLWVFNQRVTLVVTVAVICCALLAFFAVALPVGDTIYIGPLTLEISTTLAILGRRFVVTTADRSFLALVYTVGAVWFLGARFARAHHYFIPLGLAVIALLVAALSVEPFLYAALLIETAVLLSVPMLVPPGREPGQGVMRYVIFQTFAMPFVLLAGWVAAGVEANPSDQRLLQQAIVFLSLGFAFWLAVFPFYTWVPLLVKENNPYAAGFILSILPIVVFILLLHFLDAFTWLREYTQLSMLMRTVGVIMIVTGGIWAAFQRDLRRLFGYAVIIENGFALLTLSLRSTTGLEIFAASLIPRLAAFFIWALALAMLSNTLDTSGEGDEPYSGLLHRYPLISSGMMVACLSLGGLPLLAGFPMRESLFENLSQFSVSVTLWAFLGAGGLLLAGFRSLAIMAGGEEMQWRMNESWPQAILMSAGILLLVGAGLFPNILLSQTASILTVFSRLY
jgi:NADH-quinone oxidoreductase subunit N